MVAPEAGTGEDGYVPTCWTCTREAASAVHQGKPEKGEDVVPRRDTKRESCLHRTHPHRHERIHLIHTQN